MLRCAGCARMVSEWAARCPACGRSTDDAAWPAPATPATPATAAPGARRRRAVRRRPRRRALVAALGVTVAAGAAFAVHAGSGGASPLPTGLVVSTTSSGSVVVGRVDGAVDGTLASVAGTGLLVAPDGRYLATGTGVELVLHGRTAVATGRDIPFVGPPGSWRAIDFTDDDTGLVASEEGFAPAGGEVEAVTFAGHRTVLFGDAESAVGDPRALGIFAVVAPPPGGAGRAGRGGPLVERWDAGAAPVVLAATDALEADLGDPPGVPAVLSVVADPDGGRLAVVVVPDGAGSARAGIVVLDRAGAVLGEVRLGGDGAGRPAWSPGGTSLVYDVSTAAHPGVEVWALGHAPVRHPAPPARSGAVAGLGPCLWSVTGDGYLCAEGESGQGDASWLVGRAGGGGLARVLGPPLPLGWLSASGTSPT